jgi:hypothetical protein
MARMSPIDQGFIQSSLAKPLSKNAYFLAVLAIAQDEPQQPAFSDLAFLAVAFSVFIEHLPSLQQSP